MLTYPIEPYSIGTAEVTRAKMAATPIREATKVTIVSRDQKSRRKVSLDEKRAVIFLPGKRSVYSIKEGDLHRTDVSEKRGQGRRKSQPRESRGRIGSRGSTRLRREGQRTKEREESGGGRKMGKRGLGNRVNKKRCSIGA